MLSNKTAVILFALCAILMSSLFADSTENTPNDQAGNIDGTIYYADPITMATHQYPSGIPVYCHILRNDNWEYAGMDITVHGHFKFIFDYHGVTAYKIIFTALDGNTIEKYVEHDFNDDPNDAIDIYVMPQDPKQE